MTAPEPGSFRGRLVALLDEYDTAPRGTTDALLAAYVRACLSARDAFAMRVARETRRQGGSREPSQHGQPDSRPVVSTAPMYRGDPRPDATALLAGRLRRRTMGNDDRRVS